jgi:hypothetical protein
VAEREFPKQCGRCGRAYNPVQWRTLAYVGVQSMLDEGGQEGLERLELRNCACGSTLCLHQVLAEETRAEKAPFVPPVEGGGWVELGGGEAVWLEARTGLPTAWKGKPDVRNPQRHALVLGRALGAQVELQWERGRYVTPLDVQIVPIRLL